jgi:hypothetical protein
VTFQHKVWLDDIRPAPLGWTHVKSARAAITLLAEGTVTEVSLDHDLGDYAADGGDGIAVVDWMAEHDVWPVDGIAVHSANPVGRDRMLAAVDRYSPYPLAYGNSRTPAADRRWEQECSMDTMDPEHDDTDQS